MSIDLYPFQAKGVRKLNHFGGRAGLFDEMGLGKTVQVNAYVQQYLKRNPVLVVCPAGIKWNWQREAARFGIKAEVAEGRYPPKRWKPGPSVQMVIVNYDIMGGWAFALNDWLDPELVVTDECQALTNPKAIRTKATKYVVTSGQDYKRGTISRVSRRRVIATSGSPLVNRPSELFPILNMIRPDLYNSMFTFGAAYCKPERTPWGTWDYKGAKNLDKLHAELNANLMIRRRLVDVLPDLPPLSREVVVTDIHDRKQYNEARDDFINWLRKINWKKAESAERAELMVRMGYLKRLAGVLKLPYTMEWIDDHLDFTDDKVIVFAIHKAVTAPLREKYGSRCVVIDGSVTGRKRQVAVDRFNTDSRVRVCVANLKAGSAGWNCTSASTTLHVEMGWTPIDHSQGEKRIVGIERGRKGYPSKAVYLVAYDTIEERLCEMTQEKQQNSDLILDGKVLSGSLDVYSRLARELLSRNRVGGR